MLIDTFINAIYIYDDKMLLTFNYKDGTFGLLNCTNLTDQCEELDSSH